MSHRWKGLGFVRETPGLQHMTLRHEFHISKFSIQHLPHKGLSATGY